MHTPCLHEQIVSNSSEGVIVQDAQGLVVAANNAASKMMEFEIDKAVGKPMTDLYFSVRYEDGRPCPPEECPPRLVFAHGEPVKDVTLSVLTHSGLQKWLRFSALSLVEVEPAVTDQPRHVMTFIVDVTHEKHREEQQKELSERLKLALSASDTGVWEYYIASKEVMWDDCSCRMFQIDSGCFGGSLEDWAKKVHPDDLPQALAKFEDALKTHNDFYAEYRIAFSDGQLRYIAACGKIHYNAKGTPIRVLGTHTDVTTARANEVELIERSIELEQVSDRLQLAVDIEAIGIWHWEFNQNILVWDDAMFTLYGLKREDFNNTIDAWHAIVHPEDRALARESIEKTINGADKSTLEFRIVRPDGQVRHILTNIKMQTNARGEPYMLTGVNRDITLEKHAAQALHANTTRLHNMLEHMPIGSLYVEGENVSINAMAEDITGYSRGELTTLEQCFERLFNDQARRMPEPYQRMRRRLGLLTSIVMRIHRPDRTIRWIDFKGCRIEGGEVWIMKDITEQRNAEAELKVLAYFDPLTKLPNRAATEVKLESALERAKRTGSKLGLLLIDLDHFKNVNDTYGHPVGDMLLRAVADRFRQHIRKDDFLGRIGGDEFMLLIEGPVSRDRLMTMARNLVDAFSSPFIFDDTLTISARITVGISVYPEHGTDSVRLFRNADTALYHAKADGRHTFHFYTPALTQALEQRLTLEKRIERALKNDEFSIHYQPIVDVQTNNIVGAEALMRWLDPDLGPISPADFIPVAEESGLIAPIGRWVLEQSCRQMVIWQQDGIFLDSISVNLSSTQFTEDDLFMQVKQTLQQVGLDPSRLTLEITENALMQNKVNAKQELLKLRHMGVKLAIDDFGTGYSSLAYLKYFAVNTLKVDRSFIQDLPGDYSDAQITSAIISMAHSLSLKVVAEGIETVEQLHFVTERGCNSFQGYLVSPAVTAAAFADLVTQTNKKTR